MFWTARCKTRSRTYGRPFELNIEDDKFLAVWLAYPPKLLEILTERVKWYVKTYPIMVLVQPFLIYGTILLHSLSYASRKP
jgi:hypothetical protein